MFRSYVGFAVVGMCWSVGVARADLEPAGAAQEAAAPVGAAAPAAAADGGAPMDEEEAKLAAFEQSLSYQQGTVKLGDGLASVELGDGLRFLGPEDTDKLLQAWGNPPGSEALGMILPVAVSPFADEGWGVIATYDEDGHVDDEDAAEMDFAEMLADMKEETEGSNEERVKEGFDAVHLVGWAEPPHYDAKTKKLYWAKELDFGGKTNTLNYAVRVLGRKGVLQLNAVANMSQLAAIRSSMGGIIGRVEFAQGNRYADFDPKLDSLAAYGVGALIAGKVAAKVGLFKGFLALLLASKKLIIAAVIGLAALARKFFGRGTAES